ncbi:PTS lactose transporter subunit IIB [Klenkia soli]|nr:PTS lactose transporter subunit IIB [Klenkia soli]
MPTIEGTAVRKLVIACDAGMASSVLMSVQLRKSLGGVVVEHSPLDAIPADADVVLTHGKLADRVRETAGDRPVISYDQVIGDPAVAEMVRAIRAGEPISA